MRNIDIRPSADRWKITFGGKFFVEIFRQRSFAEKFLVEILGGRLEAEKKVYNPDLECSVWSL